MKRIQFTAVCGLLVVGCGLAVAQAAPPALYTAAQAASGATVFRQNCAMCHGANLLGDEGPALIGQKFAPVAGGNTVGSIFSVITQQMPLSNPASLSQAQYENVMSYILSKNGYPSGTDALAAATSVNSPVPLISTVK